MRDIVVVEAVRQGDELVFCCPYCRVPHHHGAGAVPGDGDGHRVAHCSLRSSPLRVSGYVLREVAGTAIPGPQVDRRWHTRQWRQENGQ